MTTVTNIIREPKREEILMPKDAKELLKQLYLLRAYSGFEEPVRNFIITFLDQLHIPYVNYNGNILGFNHPGAPLFSAHMDMVNTEGYKLQKGEYKVESDYVFTIDAETCMRLYRDSDKKHQTSLGADDKNGIWVILNLLKEGKQINFAFCHSEEIGGAGSGQIVQDKDCATFIEQCKYCIVIDRRNASDIIGYKNKYCLCLDDKLSTFAKNNGFKFEPAHGSISDADRFSTLVECVNISCGYYEPHSSKEYTNLNELWNTLQFCIKIVDEFVYESASASRMRDFKDCRCPYATYTTYKYTTTEKVSEYKTKTSGSSSEKKNTEKTTTQMTRGKTTTNTTDTDKTSKHALKELLKEAMDESATFCEELQGYVVPLYSDNTLPVGLNPTDILCSIPCICSADTENIGILLQESIDALLMDYYNIERGYKVFGICAECLYIQDVTSYIKALM